MTVGARLRSKAASSLPRRGPLGRARAAGDEDADAILEHLECEDEAAACGARGARGRRAGARRVHLAALPERYEPLEEPAPEPAPGDKPKKRYRRKLKKYGKATIRPAATLHRLLPPAMLCLTMAQKQRS
ncbi:required for drug-induced death protein 1 isoform X2 [Castor canadensis]|uniref:Required for drug-induced death protein 1 isoform X2 n=2 Tax=Castor canadensis TaxID=51338 RepID=A0AC58KHS3_CASCN